MPESPFKILNCFGSDVGQESARDATHALVRYSIRVDVRFSKLKQIGYKAVPDRNAMAREQENTSILR